MDTRTLSMTELYNFDDKLKSSGMDCVILVQGRDTGRGGNGRPRETRRGPLHNFIRDSSYFYKAVFDHLGTCDKCNPYNVVQAYMDRHRLRRTGMSKTLMAFILRCRKSFPDHIPQIMADEAVARYNIDSIVNSTGAHIWEIHKMSREAIVNLWLVCNVMNE